MTPTARIARFGAAATVAGVLLAAAPGATASTPPGSGTPATTTAAAGPHGTLFSDTEAFGVRVEYDIPLPAGTGTAPHVVGSTSRQNGLDSAHGLAGAPSQLDAVVSGEYVDPNGMNGGKPQRSLPQSECFSPGKNLDVVFRFPTDTQAETASLPPTSTATAQCAPGPYVEMHATDSGIGTTGTPSEALGAVVHTGHATADGVSRAIHDQLVSDSIASVSNVDILGAVHIGAVTVSGHSVVTGKAGGAVSTGTVTFSGMTAGGVPVSLANDRITVAGQSAPVDTTAGQALVEEVNNALAPSGCRATVLAHPADYPQGFILARKPPDLGVAADGTKAASMEGGMLFVCNLPASVTAHLGGFSPQRVQILVGFAYTSTQATADIGGFSLGDLGAGLLGQNVSAPIGPLAGTLGRTIPGVTTVIPGAPSGPPATAPTATDTPQRTGPSQLAGPVLKVGNYKLDPTVRLVLFAACLAGWLALTVLGIRVIRGVTAG